MTDNRSGAMYGKEGTFFDILPRGYENYIWIELIGFDNEKEDCGVDSLLAKTGFVPTGIFLLVTSVDILNTHRGLDTTYELDDFFCSYEGHAHNDERARQTWTNVQLKRLVDILHQRGIAIYISLFDIMCPRHAFDRPELRTCISMDNAQWDYACLYMTKRLADGRLYEDVFLSKALQFLRDYAFDGIHLADGLCRPRDPLQWADMSDDMLEQAGITVPDGENRDIYIAHHWRRGWIDFCTARWGSYLKKAITAIHNAGFKVAINSCWTKDPMEAKYRFGIDYRMIATLPVDLCVIENGAPTICLIDTPANGGYEQSYEERKLVHHAFRASLMLTSLCLGRIKRVPLYPVRDTNEQYDVIHHLPTALVKHSAAIFSSFICDQDGLKPVMEGHTFCLGDGLSADNWRYLRLCADNAYEANVKAVPGATLIWSDTRNEREIDALIAGRTASTHRLLSLILRRGAAVFKVAHIDDLDHVDGDILVTNPHLLPPDELERIHCYSSGRVITLSAPKDETDYSFEQNPTSRGWSHPVQYNDASEETLNDCVNAINDGLAYVAYNEKECRVQELVTGEKTSRFIVTNDEYYYTRPQIRTGRRIRSATDITKVDGYPVRIEDDAFTVLVPLMGAAIVEVEFL